MTKKILLLFEILILIPAISSAGNLGIGLHTGYGIIKYEEQTSAFGTDIQSESAQNMFLLGVSGEYSFTKPENFYLGLTTDWAFGLQDRETWTENGIITQTNDMRVFGQFYDLRFGYKNSIDSFYYRLYISGGWDGLHFKRDSIVKNGSAVVGEFTEDLSLWRTGGGIALGYLFNKWTLDGRFAYAYYPKAMIDNSSYPVTFNTDGTCLDIGLGISKKVKKVNLLAGISYTLIELKQSDIKALGPLNVVIPKSMTEIIAGIIGITYMF